MAIVKRVDSLQVVDVFSQVRLLFVLDFLAHIEIDVGLALLNVDNACAFEDRFTVLDVDCAIGRIFLIIVANHLDRVVNKLEVAGLRLVEGRLMLYAFSVIVEAV